MRIAVGAFGKGVDEGLNKFRLEMLPRFGTQDIQRSRRGHRFAIGPRARQRVVAISDGDDAGQERNLGSAQAVRVALAIEPLVMT